MLTQAGEGALGGGSEGKLAGSPPVTPLERQQLLQGREGAVPARLQIIHPASELHGPAADAGSDDAREASERAQGVATPDRVEEAASPPPADAVAAKLAGRGSERSSVGVQVDEGADGSQPSAAEAARCLRVALRFTQQRVLGAPKPSARLAVAINTLAAFVETQAAAERVQPPPAKTNHRVVRRNNVKLAVDVSARPDTGAKSKPEKDDKKKLTVAEKRLLEQEIPDTFVVSDAICAKTVGASDLSTPRFKAASAFSPADASEADASRLEDTSDAPFEAMHRPHERNERAAHKNLFQPTRAQPGRSPRAGPAASPRAGAATGDRGRASVVAPLNLGCSAAQASTAEPDDWEVLGRRSGSNQVVLRKMRKRRPEDAGERERKLLRAAVFANVNPN